MRDFTDSTLWRISAFERVQQATGTSGFMRMGGPTVLPSTLVSDLYLLDQDPRGRDVLEVMAASLRHREPLLLCLQHEELVWPVTLFPRQMLYHSPRDLLQASIAGLAQLRVLTTEPPGVKPPGHWMHERVADADDYRALIPLLWTVALQGPRSTLLAEIGGTAAYRVIPCPDGERPPAPGALGPALERLRRESASLREIATWPGMSVERASRLLNALYLASSLMITRSHPAARAQPGKPGLFGVRWTRR